MRTAIHYEVGADHKVVYDRDDKQAVLSRIEHLNPAGFLPVRDTHPYAEEEYIRVSSIVRIESAR